MNCFWSADGSFLGSLKFSFETVLHYCCNKLNFSLDVKYIKVVVRAEVPPRDFLQTPGNYHL